MGGEDTVVNELPEAPIPSSNQLPASDKAEDSALFRHSPQLEHRPPPQTHTHIHQGLGGELLRIQILAWKQDRDPESLHRYLCHLPHPQYPWTAPNNSERRASFSHLGRGHLTEA